MRSVGTKNHDITQLKPPPEGPVTIAFAWGDDTYGQLGVGSPSNISTWCVDASEKVTDVHVSGSTTVTVGTLADDGTCLAGWFAAPSFDNSCMCRRINEDNCGSGTNGPRDSDDCKLSTGSRPTTGPCIAAHVRCEQCGLVTTLPVFLQVAQRKQQRRGGSIAEKPVATPVKPAPAAATVPLSYRAQPDGETSLSLVPVRVRGFLGDHDVISLSACGNHTLAVTRKQLECVCVCVRCVWLSDCVPVCVCVCDSVAVCVCDSASVVVCV